MPKQARWLILVSSILAVIASLWTVQFTVVAQAPTKTPIGEPPSKTPLPVEPPTKAPLPTDPPTKTTVPTQASTSTAQPTATSTRTPTRTPTLRPSATASPTPVTRTPATTVVSADTAAATADPPATPSPTTALTAIESVTGTTAPPNATALIAAGGKSDPPVDPTASILSPAITVGGFILGLIVLSLVIWFGLSRLGRAITTEIHTVSLANLRLQHEAERIDRRDKVVFRADSDVLSLLEQAILDASGENIHVRFLPNGWVSSPPLLAVVDAEQTRYLFSPMPPEQVQDMARRHGLTQLLLGHATDLTAYPIDALNSTPFIVDDLSAAFAYVLMRYQAPRRPLPRSDRWYLYIARPRPSRWTVRLERRVKQTGMVRRFTDRLPTKARAESAHEHPTKAED